MYKFIAGAILLQDLILLKRNYKRCKRRLRRHKPVYPDRDLKRGMWVYAVPLMFLMMNIWAFWHCSLGEYLQFTGDLSTVCAQMVRNLGWSVLYTGAYWAVRGIAMDLTVVPVLNVFLSEVAAEAGKEEDPAEKSDLEECDHLEKFDHLENPD